MAKPLARDEDRAANVEAERVVLERRAVPVAHQEADQAGVGVVELVLVPREADAGAVDDREIVGHRGVEPDEAVVEDGYRVLGYHLGRDRHMIEASDVPGRLLVGSSGWSYPSWRPDFYPAGLASEEFLSFYSARLPSVELNTTGYRLPAEEQFQPLGSPGAGGIPVRGQGAAASAQGVRHLRGAREPARRVARPCARRRREPARRRPAAAAARLDRPAARARPAPRELARTSTSRRRCG